jgi:lambda family phage minor tail protein L
MALPETNEDVKVDQQQMSQDSAIIALYSIDATLHGGSVYYFTSGTDAGSKVTFNSIEYDPVPIEFEGLEQNKDGKMPRPLMRISNVTSLLLAEVITYKGLVGCKVTRTRTYVKYLDGHSEADPNATFLPDVFFVNRKIKQSKYVVEWELRSALDLENILIPKRQCLSMCTHRYSTTEDWATCPYEGENGYFKYTGESTLSVSEDKCGKTLTDCRLRYPTDSALYKANGLPFRGFPGIGNFGQPYR